MDLCARNSPEIRTTATTKTVEWKEHKDVLAKGVRNLFLKEYLMDTNVTFNGDVIKVHRLILAIFLPTFKRSLDVAASSEGLRDVNLNCIADRTEDVRALIEFVYTGQMTVAEGRLDHLRRLAQELSFDGLAKSLSECQRETWKDNDVGCGADGPEVQRDSDDDDEDDGGPESQDEGEEQEEGEDEENVEAVDDDDGKERAATAAEDDSHDHAKGEDNSTPEEQAALDQYCEHIFQCLRHGYVPLPQRQSFRNAAIKASSRKQAEPPRKQGSTRKKKKVIGTVCANCGREFASSFSLRRHLKLCRSPEQVPCRYCEHTFDTRNLLRRHLYDAHRREMTAERKARVNHIKCPAPDCKFECDNPLRLKMHHKRMHTADKKYKCHECEYATIRQSELNIHVTLCHLKQKNFMCDHCGSRYATQSGLYKHVRSAHQGYKHYKCEHCGKEFSTGKCYKIHVQSKHNVGGELEKHVCHVCGKSYNTRWNLQLHSRNVHNTSLESRVKVHAPRRKEEGNAGTSTSQQRQQLSEKNASTSERQAVHGGPVIEPRESQSTQQPSDHYAEPTASNVPAAVPFHELLAAIGSSYDMQGGAT